MKQTVRIITFLLLILGISLIPSASAAGEKEYYETTTMDAGDRGINDIAFVPGKSTVMAVRVDGDLVIYGLSGDLLHRRDFSEELFSIAVSPDGTKAVLGSASDGNGSATMYVVSPVNGETVKQITIKHGGIYSLEFSHDSSLLSATNGDGTVLVFRTDTYDIASEKDFGARIYSASFSPDDSAVLSGDKSGKLHIYNLGNGTVRTIQAHDDDIYDALWFNESTVLSCGKEGIIKVFNDRLELLSTLGGHNDTVYCLASSSGGRYVLSGSKDGKTVIWDMLGLSPAAEMELGYIVYSTDIHPDGDYACSGCANSEIVVISMDPDGDGFLLKEDSLPSDHAGSVDTDGDGYPDEWNQGKDETDSTTNITHVDSYPTDPAASLDADGDGVPDEWNQGMGAGNSNTNLTELDAFPDDAAASVDTDGDGYPDHWNPGMKKGDSTTGLGLDAYPDDPREWADSDFPFGDGIGDNGDWLAGFNNYLFYVLVLFGAIFLIIAAARKAKKRSGGVGRRGFQTIADEEKVEREEISIGTEPQLPYEPVKGKKREIIPNYVITHRIGSGGFAVVYAAKGLHVPSVAIKMPKTMDETLDSHIYEKFESEAAIWKKLDHANIVKLHDTGMDPLPYIAMERMEGGNLKQLLERRELSIGETVNIMLGLLDAISYAHRMATVHRDIKPENILFSSDGVPKISDWGIGKLMVSDSVTKSTGTKGTLAYSAPEQVNSREYGEVDWSTDLFQIGIVFYEMLTGVNPFHAEDPAGVISNIIHSDVPPPSSINPEVHWVLDEIVMKALAKQKKRRWRSTDVMYDRLREAVRDKN